MLRARFRRNKNNPVMPPLPLVSGNTRRVLRVPLLFALYTPWWPWHTGPPDLSTSEDTECSQALGVGRA